jgi:hypothetical protein
MGLEVIFARVNNEIVACVNTLLDEEPDVAPKAQVRVGVYRARPMSGPQDS